jgi:HK97 gp10 family phage protein
MAGDGEIIGLDRLSNTLRRLADRVRGISEDAVNELADEMVVRMKGAVPVDTGNLRDSIKKEGSGTRLTVGPRDVDYAAYVEFGTSRAPAQPYVSPVVEWAKHNAPQRIADRVRGVID